jgi:hypothetical protein
MDTSWIECAFDVAGRRVTVAVRRLGADERQRVAAEIAWFADGLVAPDRFLRAAGWSELLERILTRDVAITLSEEAWPQSALVWDELVCRAFEVFVTANYLDALIRRHLDSSRSRSCA